MKTTNTADATPDTNCYKVVNNIRGRYFSAVQNPHFPDSLKLEYHLHKPTKPRIPGSGIYIFTNLQNAIDFKEKLHLTAEGTMEVWRAEYEGEIIVREALKIDRSVWMKIERDLHVWRRFMDSLDVEFQDRNYETVKSLRLVSPAHL
jgi:hypothetical protein